jgi:hypothetical protein
MMILLIFVLIIIKQLIKIIIIMEAEQTFKDVFGTGLNGRIITLNLFQIYKLIEFVAKAEEDMKATIEYCDRHKIPSDVSASIGINNEDQRVALNFIKNCIDYDNNIKRINTSDNIFNYQKEIIREEPTEFIKSYKRLPDNDLHGG